MCIFRTLFAELDGYLGIQLPEKRVRFNDEELNLQYIRTLNHHSNIARFGLGSVILYRQRYCPNEYGQSW